MSARPVTLLIAALGGEGGGVLTDWVVGAAMAAGLPVQSTSIPGVAQRTGATTYYVEIYPETHAALGDGRLVPALYPSPGDVDLMVATELLEAGRAAENGFVTPDRTTLIAASHRVYATIEKMEMGDGRFDAARVLRALREMAKRPILFDLSRDDQARTRPLNAVLLGAIAGTGILPIARAHFSEAIRASGIAVEANLAGFQLGLELAENGPPPSLAPAVGTPVPDRSRATLPLLLAETAARCPAEAIEIVEEGLRRLADYQDDDYARLYLERLDRFQGAAPKLVAEIARRLARWMAYEDVIRVADLKSRPERFQSVRAEIRARPDEPVRVTEFFKPGIEEVAAILPERLGRALRGWGERTGRLDRWHLPMHLSSTSVSGYLRLRLLARMRGWRRRSFRYAEEQALIDRWLTAVQQAARIEPGFAIEVARLAKLLKGYSDTHRRGRANFATILEQVVAPALAEKHDGTDAVKQAREAALADPEGEALAKIIEQGRTPAPIERAAAE
jgi:indolepyruvate ferredoxin oxidoreductase beta subunit